ncbi:MAG: 1-deoxy-D-xylulose-5-phosphate reductoisomerase [Clostridia bacterium]|nr:1-deoxy-D-xylulose-5-phosphate reductoisomerase [Clostridia bacterium]
MKRVAILGVTGSIGRQAVDVISRYPEDFSISLVSAHSSRDVLLELARRFRVPVVCYTGGDPIDPSELGYPCRVFCGADALILGAREGEYDVLLNSVVGLGALEPTLVAMEKGARIALANKEMLVSAGDLVMKRVKSLGAELIPVDSEHSAIFQCLQAGRHEEIDRLVLTSSGGAFRDVPVEQLDRLDPAKALAHPNWRMGKKITLDCATMVNKGFEVIEAKHLFDVPLDHIETVIHRESVVHSMVRFCDGSTIAQLSQPDMRLPIQYALTYPNRVPSPVSSPMPPYSLTFDEVDLRRYPCFGVMLEAARKGGLYPAVALAADEVLARAFSERRIRYSEIAPLMERVLARFDVGGDYTLADVRYINSEAEKYTQSVVKR